MASVALVLQCVFGFLSLVFFAMSQIWKERGWLWFTILFFLLMVIAVFVRVGA